MSMTCLKLKPVSMLILTAVMPVLYILTTSLMDSRSPRDSALDPLWFQRWLLHFGHIFGSDGALRIH